MGFDHRAHLLCVTSALLAASWDLGGAALASTSFSEVSQEAGVEYLQHAAQEPGDCVFGVVCDLDRMTGGAAVADVNLDGAPDLFVTRLDAPDLLFINQGGGRFVEGAAAAGLSTFDLQSNAAAFADIDNDGDPDLVVTVIGAAGDLVNSRNFLFINDGSGHFSEEAVLRGVDAASSSGRSTWVAEFGDFDRDGYVDLFLGEWASVAPSMLLRNRGAEAPGFFELGTEDAELDLEGAAAFAATFVDLDHDGFQELALAADFGTSRLFWNERNGTFSDGTAAASVGTDENGMGSTFGDIDADGDLDWFVTSIFDPADTCAVENCAWGATGNRLYLNEGGRSFVDGTDAAGVRAGGWGWGAVFFDMDNDGDLDLVMTNGVDFPNTAIDAAFENDPMRVWENNGSGEMTEVSAGVGISDTSSGKGLLTFDYDADGDLDLFVVNNAAGPRLYRNDLAAEHEWVRVEVIGGVTHRDGGGAIVTVRADPGGPEQRREVGVGSHFLGQSERELHFGLGPGDGRVDEVRVEFPVSGRVRFRRNVRANRTIVIREVLPSCGVSGPAVILGLGTLALRRMRSKRRS